MHFLKKTCRKRRNFLQPAVNDVIYIKGEIHSREYKKYISDTDVEIRVAHEVVAIDFKYTVD